MPINVKNSYNKPRNQETLKILQKYNSFEKPAYHCLGNHEFDFSSVEEVVSAYNMPNNYYSFHIGGWHFIVLDGNYIKTADGKYEHYDHSHYFWQDLPWMATEELHWLENELQKTNEPVVIFSHQPLYNRDWAEIKNWREFEDVIQKAKKQGKDVRLCVYGHLHVDEVREQNGVLYYGANSMTNMWVDEDYQAFRFSKEIDEKYPNVRYTIPYDRAIFSIVTLDDEGVAVKGVNGNYIQPGPEELGYEKPISPSSKSWSRKWRD
jgi:UDP-2,3-diacylglucosamine pyrophosphatase LpxH